MSKILSVKRNLTSKDKVNILVLRHGEDYEVSKQPLNTMKHISHILLINIKTVENFIYRFYREGKDAMLDRRIYGYGRIAEMIGNYQVEKELLSTEILVKWAHLSLRERVHKVFTRFRVKVSINKLWRFYRSNGIKHRMTKYAYRNEVR